MRRQFSEQPPDPASLIQNHDLRQLVGEAIAETMRLSAGEGPHQADMADTIGRLADAAPELWDSEATAADTTYVDFKEESVADLFVTDATNFNNVTALDQPAWRGFLDTLNKTTEAGADDDLLDYLAKLLHQRLAEMVRGKVKQDFMGETSAKGRGFASLHLMSMGRLTAGVEKLLEQSSDDVSTELLDQLKELNQKIPAAADQQFRRVDDPKDQADLASTLAEIQQFGPRIESRLNDLAKAVDKTDKASRLGHTETHKRLAAIEAQLREALRPKEIGEDPTEKKLPPEVLDAARELLERGDQEQQALAQIALGDHDEADRIIQELKNAPLVEAFRLLTLEGNNWYNAGQFDRAIEPYEQALSLKPDDIDALNNAALAHNQARLGSIAEHQLRAIELLERAADETQATDPWLWAGMQNNLGVAYRNLPTGDREENLAQAIGAYQSALEVYTREAHPVAWTGTQKNLGNAYSNLPTGDREENLTRVIDAFESALEVCTREAHPVAWAMTQNNLAISLANMASVDDDHACDWLEKALASGKAALAVYTAKMFLREHVLIMKSLKIVRKAYEAAGCAGQLPFDQIAPAE